MSSRSCQLSATPSSRLLHGSAPQKLQLPHRLGMVLQQLQAWLLWEGVAVVAVEGEPQLQAPNQPQQRLGIVRW